MRENGPFGPDQTGPGQMMPGREHFPGPFRGRLDYGDYGMQHSGHGLFAWLALLLLAVLVGLAIYALIRVAKRRPSGMAPTISPVSPADPALHELRVRYARGDVGRDEYLQKAADLGEPSLPGPPAAPPPISP